MWLKLYLKLALSVHFLSCFENNMEKSLDHSLALNFFVSCLCKYYFSILIDIHSHSLPLKET